MSKRKTLTRTIRTYTFNGPYLVVCGQKTKNIYIQGVHRGFTHHHVLVVFNDFLISRNVSEVIGKRGGEITSNRRIMDYYAVVQYAIFLETKKMLKIERLMRK